MIPHKPEAMPENTKEMQDAPEGRHRMKLNRVKEDVNSPRWTGDVWEFVGGGYQISEFVDAKTVWKYSRLAKAIGGQALKSYQDTDADGNSLFDPLHYLGSEVSILVEETVRNGEIKTRIKKIDPVENPNDWDTGEVPPDLTANDDPTQEDEKLPAKPDDDIPF